MKKQELDSKIYGAADAASVDWYRRQCREPFTSMYLYYKPGTIAFWIGENPLNEDWILAENERISPAKTYDAVRSQIIGLAQRLPIL